MSSMTSERIAFTGAMGLLSGRVARLLDERGILTRLIVRRPLKASKLKHAEVAVSTYVDHDALLTAVKDIGTVLFVSGHEAEDRSQEPDTQGWTGTIRTCAGSHQRRHRPVGAQVLGPPDRQSRRVRGPSSSRHGTSFATAR